MSTACQARSTARLPRPPPLPRSAPQALPRPLARASEMNEVLVVANRTLGGAKLLEAVRARASAGDVRFRLVVPQSKPTVGLVIYDEAVREAAQARVDLALS